MSERSSMPLKATLQRLRAARDATRWRVVSCTCVVGALVLLTPFPAVAQELIDRVLAVVGGDIITVSDVRAAIELGRVQVAGAAEQEREVLSQLIDRALVLAEVDRFAPPEPPAAAIDSAFEGVVARFNSPGEFDAVLARLGIDRGFVRELLREDLRIRAYLDQRFTAQTSAEQRAMVDEWIAGLRRRGGVVDRSDLPVSRPPRGTAEPGRD
jgi:hypothetical protein